VPVLSHLLCVFVSTLSNHVQWTFFKRGLRAAKQLHSEFYKALLESNKSRSLEVTSGEIDFIEPVDGEYKKHKVYFTNEEYLFVRRQIKETYQRIQNLEFNQGCEDDQCIWCSFDKHN
jgi:hypothetical protein